MFAWTKGAERQDGDVTIAFDPVGRRLYVGRWVHSHKFGPMVVNIEPFDVQVTDQEMACMDQDVLWGAGGRGYEYE